jgi:hypothetical protein
MATTRGQFSQLLAPGLQALLFEWLPEHQEEYSQFMNVGSDDGAYLEDQIIAGLGLARLKNEGDQISYDDPIQGGTKRYLHQTYALGWQVTEEMMDDEKYDIMSQIPGELMKSCRQFWEQYAANTLIGGFSTTVSANGVSMFNVAQPNLGGGVQSNMLSPFSDLSVTSVQDLIILYENMLNERGLRVMISPKMCWIPPEMQFIAGEVFQSQFMPFTGTNEINPVQGRVTPAVLHYLTSSTMWTFSAGDDPNSLKFFWRMKPITETQDDFETKGVKHSLHFRISTGCTDWRGWAAGSN